MDAIKLLIFVITALRHYKSLKMKMLTCEIKLCEFHCTLIIWEFEKGLSDCDAYGNPYWALIKGATQERCQVDSVALELPGGEWPGDLQTRNESNTVWAFEEDNDTEQKTVFVAIFWFNRSEMFDIPFTISGVGY